MSSEKLTLLLTDFCETVGLYPPEIVRRSQVQVKGMEVVFRCAEGDSDHFYFAYQFGAIAAGRTLKVFRLMLEANVLVYAKDDAVLGWTPTLAELFCQFVDPLGRRLPGAGLRTHWLTLLSMQITGRKIFLNV